MHYSYAHEPSSVPQKYIRNLKRDTASGSYEVERIEFGKIYTEGSGFSVDGAIGDSSGSYQYDGKLSIYINIKAITRVPWTGEKGVLSLKSIWYLDDIDFDESSGELISTTPDRILVFTHYKSLESSFENESGRSIVYPRGHKINHSQNVDNRVIPFADRDAEYFDFEFDSRGNYAAGEYGYKIRDKYDLSSRSSLLSEFGVSGNFESGWWDEITFTSSAQSTGTSWNTLDFGLSSKPRDIVSQWLGSGTPSQQVLPLSGGDRLNIQASSWSGNVRLKSVAQAADSGGLLEAPQIDIPSPMPTGSALNGGSGRDRILAKAGWDVIDGGSGDDYIRAGNGRDIITGGLGNDEIWGDFGWNTYTSEKDGYRDLIAIKSDEYLINWLNGKAGNNPNGEKADIIEGLDSNDVIKILGVSTEDLSFSNATAHGVSGIGIYGRGALEAIYTGGDLSIDQIRAMTSGDLTFAGGGYGWTG